MLRHQIDRDWRQRAVEHISDEALPPFPAQHVPVRLRSAYRLGRLEVDVERIEFNLFTAAIDVNRAAVEFGQAFAGFLQCHPGNIDTGNLGTNQGEFAKFKVIPPLAKQVTPQIINNRISSF